MARPGPAPKPTQLKMLEGSAQHKALCPDEFRPATKAPECPEHLKGEAQREWNRLSAELVRYGMVSEVDRGVLSMICTVWARYVEAEEAIARIAEASSGSGLLIRSPTGYPVQSPWVGISNRSIELYRSLLQEFGLSPAARSRVVPGDFQLQLPGIETPMVNINPELSNGDK